MRSLSASARDARSSNRRERRTSVMPLSASLTREELRRRRPSGRSSSQKNDARDDHEHQHDHRGRHRFLLRGPEHLAQLDARLEEELPEVAAVSARWRTPRRRAAGRRTAPPSSIQASGRLLNRRRTPTMPPRHQAGWRRSVWRCRLPAGTADGCFASSFIFNRWQARRESNPQPAVLETAALPIELLACSCLTSEIFATTPAPTVRPPSRMAKRRPSSIAIGLISSHLHLDVVARHHHLGVLRQLDRARSRRSCGSRTADDSP